MTHTKTRRTQLLVSLVKLSEGFCAFNRKGEQVGQSGQILWIPRLWLRQAAKWKDMRMIVLASLRQPCPEQVQNEEEMRSGTAHLDSWQ
jgi:hypothetical protein